MLPNLALRLCTSTAGFGQSESKRERRGDSSDDEEPLTRRAERNAARGMPTLATLRLTDMPRDAIATIVRAAALGARNAPMPAVEICEWMQNFCRAARDLTCDDQWYRLALEAFGFVPEMAIRGAEPALPAQSAFKSWRAFFNALCEAFKTKDQLFWESAGVMLQRANWLGDEWSAPSDVRLRYMNPNPNQRNLDTLLAGMQRNLVRTNNFTLHAHPYALQLSNDASPRTAVTTLLVLRGAKLDGYEYWIGLDEELYVTIVRGMTRQIDWEIALEDMRQLLAKGADPSYNGRTMRSSKYPSRPPRPYGFSAYPALLTLAVLSCNNEAIRLLLDAGAKYPRHSLSGFAEFFRAMRIQTSKEAWHNPQNNYSVDLETTERLIALLQSGIEHDPRQEWDSNYPESYRRHVRTWFAEVPGTVPEWIKDAWRPLLAHS